MKISVENKFSVDVVLPNFNKAKFIEEAINSVLSQTFKNWYLYIIDDNSSDNSEEIIDKFSNLKNITIIKLQKNKGPSFCRNYALRISQSKYIQSIRLTIPNETFGGGNENGGEDDEGFDGKGELVSLTLNVDAVPSSSV